MGNVVYQVQKTAGQCFSKWGPDGDIGTNGCRALPSPVLDVLALVLPLSFVLAVPTPYPQPWTYSCFSPAANVTVSLPVRGCVQDEFCTRDSATGPGFTLSGSCCQGSRCNSDLRNKTYFSPQFPPLVLLPPPRSTTLAPNKSVSTSTSAPSSTVTTKATPVPTTTRSTTKAITPAQTNQTSPQEVGHETFREEEASLAGGASGHQDRRNMGQDPIKDVTHSKGSAAPWAGWVTLLLAMAAGTLL